MKSRIISITVKYSTLVPLIRSPRNACHSPENDHNSAVPVYMIYSSVCLITAVSDHSLVVFCVCQRRPTSCTYLYRQPRPPSHSSRPFPTPRTPREGRQCVCTSTRRLTTIPSKWTARSKTTMDNRPLVKRSLSVRLSVAVVLLCPSVLSISFLSPMGYRLCEHLSRCPSDTSVVE